MESRRKKARADATAGADTAAVHGLPDHLLASIFLRLPSLLHLVRAACACRRWRRVAADGGFLRDFRALRVPGLVAGNFRVARPKYGPRPPGSDPVFLPSPSSPVKDDFLPEQFSFDFLPESGGGGQWEIADGRGFLYLLLNEGTDATPFRFPGLVVCEPLTRRCMAIPPPAEFHGCRCFGAFLLDGEDTDTLGRVTLQRFRVLCALYRYGVATACVFSSSSGSGGGWTAARCTADTGMEPLPGLCSIFFVGHSPRFAHWVTTGNSVLALDKDTAEFSLRRLPADMGRWNQHSVVVIAGERGPVRMVGLGAGKLRVWRQEGSSGWILEARIRLSQFVAALPGYKECYFSRLGKIISVTRGRVIVLAPSDQAWVIAVDLKTMEFRLADGDRIREQTYPYELPWPPVKPCSVF
ncbi:hypothetical protein ACP4OV_023802 [Aristida adscensionis]